MSKFKMGDTVVSPNGLRLLVTDHQKVERGYFKAVVLSENNDDFNKGEIIAFNEKDFVIDREPGYYKVRPIEADHTWYISYWNGQKWVPAGITSCEDDNYFSEIGQKIEL